MSDKPKEGNSSENENLEETEENKTVDESNNNLGTCAGGLTDEQLKTLQEDLDRAKEDNSYSKTSACVVM